MRTERSSASKVPCGGTYPPGFESSTGVRIFLNLFQDLTGAILSVVGDVSVDNEAPVVTSSISRICRLSLSKVLIDRGGPSGWAWDALAYLNFGPLSKKNFNPILSPSPSAANEGNSSPISLLPRKDRSTLRPTPRRTRDATQAATVASSPSGDAPGLFSSPQFPNPHPIWAS